MERGEAIIVLHLLPSETNSPSVAHVDWLGFTLKLSEEKVKGWLFKELAALFWLHVTEMKKPVETATRSEPSWASWLTQQGVPPNVIREIGGESSDMVRRYAHLAPEQFAQHARVVDVLLDGTSTAQQK